mmetsp:Transcript_43863/g.109864  ORF Transcript_43863/g.109864 Transcript_43863/m.109864 type:complete len:204 (-) Transcript_43863:20-631(-)
MTNRLPLSEAGNSVSSMAIDPECRNVAPTPPMVLDRKRMGKEDPAMNITQLKKKTTWAVAIIIQHLTCPARNRVSGVPIAAPKLKLAKSRATSAVEKKAPSIRWYEGTRGMRKVYRKPDRKMDVQMTTNAIFRSLSSTFALNVPAARLPARRRNEPSAFCSLSGSIFALFSTNFPVFHTLDHVRAASTPACHHSACKRPRERA